MKPSRVSWLTCLLLTLSVAQVSWGVGNPTITAAGNSTGNVQSGAWTMLNSELRNPSDEIINGLVAVKFKNDSHTEYATQAWVPPHATRRVWLLSRVPTYIAAPTKPDAEFLSLETSLLQTTEFSTRTINRDTSNLVAARSSVITAFLGDMNSTTQEQLVIQARNTQSPPLPTTLANMTFNNLPPIAAGWDGISCFVIAAENPQMSPAQMLAIRQWIYNGGNLWVQLDRVNPVFLQRLLGQDWDVEIVDSTSLNAVQLSSQPQTIPHNGYFYDPPVGFKRVVAPDMNPIFYAGQWPAAVQKTVGKGKIIVTTLEARGWMTPTKTPTQELTNLGLIALGDQIHTALRNPPEGPNTSTALPLEMRKYVTGQVGHQTLTRTPIFIVFGALTGGMILTGCYFARKKRLELASFSSIGLSVIATGVLVTMGTAKQRAVPITASTLQIAEILPSQQTALISGQMAVYSPSGLEQQSITSADGALLLPNFAGQSGNVHQFLIQDFNQWGWNQLTVPSGSFLPATYTKIVPIAQPISVHGQFNEQGFTAELNASQLGLEDLLLVAPNGMFTPAYQSLESGLLTISTGEQQILPPHQYMGGAILSDLQNQRQSIYRLALEDHATYTTPRLLAWSRSFDPEFAYSQSDMAKQMTTVVSIPISIDQPTSGQKIRVPAPFFSFDVTSENHGTGTTTAPLKFADKHSTIFDPRKAEFQEASLRNTFYLKFTLPAALRNLQLQQAKLHFDIQAPGRPVEIYANDPLTGKTTTQLRTFTDAVGVQTLDLSGNTLPSVDNTGTIVFEIRVGDPVNSAASPDIANARWLVRSTAFSAQGIIP